MILAYNKENVKMANRFVSKETSYHGKHKLEAFISMIESPGMFLYISIDIFFRYAMIDSIYITFYI